MTNVLVFGTIGQLGNALGRAEWPAGWTVEALDQFDADFTDVESLRDHVLRRRPDLIVNAAAYTAVDKAESETVLNWQVNAVAPAVIAQAAREADASLVHISTDYVHDGAKTGAWLEDDPLGPLGAYGAAKAAGEIAIRSVLPRHLILRTSWVYAAHGNNFVKTMLRLGRERDRLTIVDDQWGRPTEATDLAEALIYAVDYACRKDGFWGTYNFTNAGEATTWARFASEIFRQAEAWYDRAPEIVAIPTSDYPTPARRPPNSVLDLGKWQATFAHQPRPWKDALASTLLALQSQM